MRLVALTAVTMVAFAANSLLNRAALSEDAIGPADFAAIRVASGAAMLALLLILRRGARRNRVPSATGGAALRPPRPDSAAVLGLSAYMLGFSFAYVSLDAGVGALALFGGVQVTMFGAALLEGERPSARRWLGVAMGLAGLAALFWPSGPETGGSVSTAPGAFALMIVAAVGWGVYSLRGRLSVDPLRATAWNFVYAAPLALLAPLVAPLFAVDPTAPTPFGVGLAVLSGAGASALGYALWYALLPSLGATRAALSQLSAPVIALALGAALLGETIGVAAILAAALVLGGVAVGVSGRKESAR